MFVGINLELRFLGHLWYLDVPFSCIVTWLLVFFFFVFGDSHYLKQYRYHIVVSNFQRIVLLVKQTHVFKMVVLSLLHESWTKFNNIVNS